MGVSRISCQEVNFANKSFFVEENASVRETEDFVISSAWAVKESAWSRTYPRSSCLQTLGNVIQTLLQRWDVWLGYGGFHYELRCRDLLRKKSLVPFVNSGKNTLQPEEVERKVQTKCVAVNLGKFSTRANPDLGKISAKKFIEKTRRNSRL